MKDHALFYNSLFSPDAPGSAIIDDGALRPQFGRAEARPHEKTYDLGITPGTAREFQGNFDG
jgi:hypothetical protein